MVATVYRTFVEQAATLVAGYGGSMSGEHGDGRARSALLPAMYSPAALDLFGQVKACFDPDNRLNPGVLVDPRPVDSDLRTTALVGRFDHFAEAVHRCTGVGKCLADNTAGLGVMCPSYLATREEKDSTRGRARVLQEMINGDVIQLGWKSAAVHSRARPLPVLQGLRPGLPDRHRHGGVQGRRCWTGPTPAGSARAATTRWAGCPAGPG